jgi:predicted small integral membrane protein
MAIRYLKMILLICISLLGLLFAIQNLANLDQAYASLAYVMSNQDHVAYPNSAFPAITSPVLIWMALGAVLLGEFGAGFLSAKGSWDLFANRNASADVFNAAKTFGILGCGIAVVTWLGLFMAIGGAYFQMWQTVIGTGSWSGAFYMVGASGVVLIFLNMKDE